MAALGYLEVRAAYPPKASSVGIYPAPRIIEPGLSIKDRVMTLLDNVDLTLGAVEQRRLPFQGGFSAVVLDAIEHPGFKQPVRIGDKVVDVTPQAVVHVLNCAEEIVARISTRALAEAPHRLDTMLLRRTR